MRILIVKTSSLGDVIHTLPAVTDAASAIPGIRFDWAVEEAFAEIPGWHPAVEKVIPVALRRWRKTLLARQTREQWRDCKQELRSAHYDGVIDAQGLVKSAFIARLVDAPRYGMDSASARERLAVRAYDHGIAVPRKMHAVERIRLLFASVLDYPLPETQGDYGLRSVLADSENEAQASLLFFHGTARAEKLWPETHWVALAELAAAAGYRVWLPWGSNEERERAQRIAAPCGNVEVLPRLDLMGLSGKLLQVAGAVAVDTGLGHLAAALDVPTVSLYGPTDTSLIGAYGQNQVHIQSPVGTADTSDPQAMMRSITPAAVWHQLLPMLPGER